MGEGKTSTKEYGMKASEALYKAADLIDQRGWTFNTDGWHNLQDTTPLCAEGAICAAMGATKAIDHSDAHTAMREYVDNPKIWDWNDGTYWFLQKGFFDASLSWDD